MNVPKQKTLLRLFVIGLCCANSCLACSGPGGFAAIVANGYMARGYGQVSAVLAAGTLYLQVRRSGWSRTTMGLAVVFVLVYFSNPGWHYSGIHGDCGYQELDEAKQAIFYVGALLAWQVIAALRLIWRPKLST